jgi:hypothetical protein
MESTRRCRRRFTHPGCRDLRRTQANPPLEAPGWTVQDGALHFTILSSNDTLRLNASQLYGVRFRCYCVYSLFQSWRIIQVGTTSRKSQTAKSEIRNSCRHAKCLAELAECTEMRESCHHCTKNGPEPYSIREVFRHWSANRSSSSLNASLSQYSILPLSKSSENSIPGNKTMSYGSRNR